MNLAPITIEHGERYFNLTVLRQSKGDHRRWKVGCVCGFQFFVRRQDLMKGRVRECIRCTNGPSRPTR